MTPTRIVLGEMPAMVRDLFKEAVVNDADLLIVGEVSDPADAAKVIIDTDADVLVNQIAEGHQNGRHRILLYEAPWLSVVSIRSDGHSAELCVLEPRCETIEPLGLAHLLEALRRTRLRRPAANRPVPHGPRQTIAGSKPRLGD